MSNDTFGIVVDTREKAPWNFEEGGFFHCQKSPPRGGLLDNRYGARGRCGTQNTQRLREYGHMASRSFH